MLLVVHLVGVVLGVLLGPDLVDLVHTLGLRELVDSGTDKASNDLLGKGVADGPTCSLSEPSGPFSIRNAMQRALLALVVFPGPHARERWGTGGELVCPLALVLFTAVHLTVSIRGIAWVRASLTFTRIFGSQ